MILAKLPIKGGGLTAKLTVLIHVGLDEPCYCLYTSSQIQIGVLLHDVPNCIPVTESKTQLTALPPETCQKGRTLRGLTVNWTKLTYLLDVLLGCSEELMV